MVKFIIGESILITPFGEIYLRLVRLES